MKIAGTRRNREARSSLAICISLVWSCSTSSRIVCEPPVAQGAAKPGTAEVVLISGGDPCKSGGRDIGSSIARTTCDVANSFRSLGFDRISRIDRPKRDDLLQAVGAARHSPVIFLYSGHATLVEQGGDAGAAFPAPCRANGPRCVSELCLADGLVPVDDVVRAISPATPFTLLILDACSSADVDVRLARSSVAVVSASPLPIETSEGGDTLMSLALLDLPSNVEDTDCDARLGDIELFDGLVSGLRQGSATRAIPKLRRQAWQSPGLAALPGKCPSTGNLSAPPKPPVVTGTWSEGAELLRSDGVVERDAPLIRNGEVIPAERLVPVPCDTDKGQCFRRR